MKKRKNNKTKLLNSVSALLILLFIGLFSSCSSDIPQICKISLGIDETQSRSLSATIDPINNYTVFYKSIYKGSDSHVFGDMSLSDSYNKLSTNGILVSQGLWEIKAIFKPKENNEPQTYIPTESDIVASSGDIFINLNTSNITVRFNSNKGYLDFSSYELRNIPRSITNPTISVLVYKYDEAAASFINSPIVIPVEFIGTSSIYHSTETVQLDSGLYYAVISIKGTVSGTSKTIFTDCIGFLVRSGLTTNISGYCDKYNTAISSNEVKNSNEPGGASNTIDIKDYSGSEFNEDVYKIVDTDYIFVADNPANYEKELKNTQNVTIDMNGHAIINATNEKDKTYFLLSDSSSLTIYNSVDRDKTVGPVTIATKKMCQEANYIVNGGTLTIGSLSSDLQKGEIALQGIPIDQAPPATEKNSAIEFTSYGGTINLLAPSVSSSINIENTIRGISRRISEEDQNIGLLNLDINMKNSSITATGETQTSEAGIYIDGTKYTTEPKGYYKGTISIHISGIGSSKESICTSNANAKYGNDHACILVKNYNGSINITLDNYAYLKAKSGCPIYLENCNGPITISIDSTCTLAYKSSTYQAIMLVNCSEPSIDNRAKIETP